MLTIEDYTMFCLSQNMFTAVINTNIIAILWNVQFASEKEIKKNDLKLERRPLPPPKKRNIEQN